MEFYTDKERESRKFLHNELKKFISNENRKELNLNWPYGSTEQYLDLLIDLRETYERVSFLADTVDIPILNENGINNHQDFERFKSSLDYEDWQELDDYLQNVNIDVVENEILQFTIDNENPFFKLSDKINIRLTRGVYKIVGKAKILNKLDGMDLIMLSEFNYPNIVNSIKSTDGDLPDNLFINHEEEYDREYLNDYAKFINFCEDEKFNYEITVTITRLDRVASGGNNQKYRNDNNSQCLINLFERKYPSSKNIIENLRITFPDGVPHNELKQFANISNCDIILHDIFGNGFHRVNTDKSGVRTLHAINNVPDHLNPLPECGVIITEEEIENIENVIMKKIQRGKITKLYTEEKSYTVVRDEESNERVTNFIRDTNFKRYSMPTSDTELTEFLEHGYIVYQKQTMKEFETDEFVELDHIRSFSQFKNSKYYSGFPTKIPKFQKTDKIMGEGYYQCDISFPEGHPLEKIHSGNRIIPKPLIECLRTHGATINITHGAWSFTSWDWEFPQELIDSKDYTVVSGLLGKAKNNTVYRMPGTIYWAEHIQEQFDSNYNQDRFDFGPIEKQKGDVEIDRDLYHEVHYDSEENEIVIVPHKYKKYHTLHIAGYITSYAHTHLIDTYMLQNIDIYHIVVDGLYIHKRDIDKVKPIKNWRLKKNKIISPTFQKLYSVVEKREWPDRKNDYPRIICANGEGGAGKTTFFIGNKELNIVPKIHDYVYITNAHELLYDKSDDAQNTAVVQSFRSPNPYKSGQHIHPSWIILDESHRYLNILPEIIHIYPDSGIIVIIDCNDKGLPYQLGTIYPSKNEYNKYIDELNKFTSNKVPSQCAELDKLDHWKKENYEDIKKKEYEKRGIKFYDCFDGYIDYEMFDLIIEFTTDYRCLCPKLKKLKNRLRKCNNKRQALKALAKYVSKISVKEILEVYKNDEFILTGRRRCKNCQKEICRCGLEYSKNYLNFFTKKFFEKGMEKYRINKNFNRYRNGQIVYTDPSEHRDKRHAFTFYSIQGKTIEKNIYIDLSNIFDYRSIYVAVSRARYISQLKWFCEIPEPPKPKPKPKPNPQKPSQTVKKITHSKGHMLMMGFKRKD